MEIYYYNKENVFLFDNLLQAIFLYFAYEKKMFKISYDMKKATIAIKIILKYKKVVMTYFAINYVH